MVTGEEALSAKQRKLAKKVSVAELSLALEYYFDSVDAPLIRSCLMMSLICCARHRLAR